MIVRSPLAAFLVVERHRPRMASVGLATPFLVETAAGKGEDPYLASTTRGTFVQTHPTRDGTVRYAFFECPLEDEAAVVARIYDVVAGAGPVQKSLSGAVARMAPVTPGAVLLPRPEIDRVLGTTQPKDQIDKLLSVQGYLDAGRGMRVIPAPLREGCALVVGHAERAGVYTRVGESMGLLLRSVPKSFIAVDSRGVA